MSSGVSLALFTEAAAPGIGLATAGLAWLYFGKPVRAIPATLLSLGIALLALTALIVLVYSTSIRYALEDATLLILLLAMPAVIYVMSLIVFVRRNKVSSISVTVLGALGLIPLWFLGGFVVMSAACSFGTEGC
jgi:hypothetical protein